MTNRKFWAKLEDMIKKKRPIWEIAELLEIAYYDNLDIICGCEKINENEIKQFYINFKYENLGIQNNYMLCYTDFNKARKDTIFEGKGEILPLRIAINDIMDKKELGGMIINNHPRKEPFIIDKFYLTDREQIEQEAMERMIRTDPALFEELISHKQ